MKYKRKNKIGYGKTTIAITQILILVIATIAFSWMIGGEVEEVSALVSDETPCLTTHCNGNLIYGSKRNAEGICVEDNSPSGYKKSCPDGCAFGICKLSGSSEEETTTCTGECMNQNLCKGTQEASGCTVPGEVCCKDGAVDDKTNDNRILEIGEDVAVAGGTELVKKEFTKVISKITGVTTAAQTTAFNTAFAEAYAATGDTLYASEMAANAANAVKPIGKIASFLKGPWGQLLKNAAWAAAAYLVINYFAKKYASQRNAGDISIATGIGAIIGVLTVEIIGGPIGWVAAVITIAAAGIYMLVGYQIYSREIFTFRTGLWQPPEGGADCNKCNSLRVAGQNGCSEYICHSYGAACDWINNETKYETCVEVNIGDVAAPIITPAKEIYGENVFLNNNYDYTASSAGAKIIYNGEGGATGKCVPAFTPVKLAFKTNENANCRIGITPAVGTTDDEKFKTMKDMAEGSAHSKNHTLQLPSMVTASTSSLENAGYELTNNGNYKFYIRCEDVRGNINKMDYVMSFCVQQGPDTNPPKITGTNPAQNAFEPYGIDKIENFQVYTNEPADCKWDFQSKDYNFMNYNFSKCSQSIDDKIRGFDFGCQGNLTGFKNGVENKYYISCMDQPELKGTIKENKRNAGAPYELILKGTGKLLIENVKINGKANGTTIKDSRENVNVKIEVMTFGGAEEGKARCKYSEDKIAYSLFDNNNNRNYITPNTQNLYMENGTYKYFLQCFDIAGNIAETMINFGVEVDKSPPIVVRVYKEDDYLKLITDELGKCVYFPNGGCTYLFDEGTLMTSLEEKEYYAEWNIKNDLYIKCKDEYGNMPGPDECSIIARPFEIFELQ